MKNLLIILSFLIIFTGCKKSVDALPEATQSGSNTFGLKLNGEFWVPQKFAGINALCRIVHASGLQMEV